MHQLSGLISTPEITNIVAAHLRSRSPASARLVFEMAIWGSRADVALLDGGWVGVEIKSDTDSCRRLVWQIPDYQRVFSECALVITSRHLPAAERIVPESWGLAIARRGVKGLFLDWRHPPAVHACEPRSLLQVAWKVELMELCRAWGLPARQSHTCGQLRQRLVDARPGVAELRCQLTALMARRENWLNET